MSGNIVKLNVGGTLFATTVTTLTKYPDSLLAMMVNGQVATIKDEQGALFIDRDGRLFRHVLNFLRDGDVKVAEILSEREQLLAEAKFYSLHALVAKIKGGCITIVRRCGERTVAPTYATQFMADGVEIIVNKSEIISDLTKVFGEGFSTTPLDKKVGNHSVGLRYSTLPYQRFEENLLKTGCVCMKNEVLPADGLTFGSSRSSWFIPENAIRDKFSRLCRSSRDSRYSRY